MATSPLTESTTRSEVEPSWATVFGLIARQRKSKRAAVAVWISIALVAILLLAAVARLWGLDREGFWGDEYAQVELYRLPLHYTCWYALTQHWFGPPDFVVGWFAYQLSPTVWACRLPAALWGVSAVAIFFFLVKRLASWQEGIIAASLLAICPMHVVLSQDARPYSICLTLILLTFLLFLRAYERPSTKRLILFGLVAYAAALTRVFTPTIILFVLGLTVCGTLWFRRIGTASKTSGVDTANRSEHDPLKRLCMTLLIVGLAILPVVLFLYSLVGPKSSAVTGSVPNGYGVPEAFSQKLMSFAAIAYDALNESYGPWVLLLAGFGVVVVWRNWRNIAPEHRCVLAAMLLSGPAVLTGYTSVSGVLQLYDRYNFYLMPIVAVFASLAVCAMLRWWSAASQKAMICLPFAVLVLASVFTHPGRATFREMQSYRRVDWRGCARRLEGKIQPDDVVMVLTEQPFGRVQNRFFGKYEWEVDQRPLGEAIWTLAVSDAHFDRLSKQRGRVHTVICYEVQPQSMTRFVRRGLAKAPDGFELTKFRGLDLLTPTTRKDSVEDGVLSACRMLLELPRDDSSTNIVPLTMIARMQLHRGDGMAAAGAFAQARALVPSTQQRYFDALTTSWTPELVSLPNHAETMAGSLTGTHVSRAGHSTNP